MRAYDTGCETGTRYYEEKSRKNGLRLVMRIYDQG